MNARALRRAALTLAALAIALGLRAPGAFAQDDAPGPASLHAQLAPAQARLGERMTYTGTAVVPRGTPTLKWLPAEEDEALAWSPLRARLARGEAADTLTVEAEVQIFRIGAMPVTGLRLQSQDRGQPTVWRLPPVDARIVPVLAAADSNADLHGLRGPLEAPWWEKVPWLLAILAGVGAFALVLAWRLWRRRGAVAAPGIVERKDPATLALERLAELRARGLAARGRYAEHAFDLTRILRSFLESTLLTPRPGDTTAGLQARLGRTGLSGDELEQLMDLLRYWDRVKFARQATTALEAQKAEEAVEGFVRRHAPRPPATESQVA